MILPIPLTLFAVFTLVVAQDATSAEVSTTSAAVFDAEKTVLSSVDVIDYPELQFGESLPDLPGNIEKRTQRLCKVQPGDNAWPVDILWSVLGAFVGSSLVKPLPLAAPCYKGVNYNANTCANIVANWGDSDLQ